MNEILLAKALANFLHREIVEDYQVKYNISQKDMEIMNRKAVDRAKNFTEILSEPKKLETFTVMYSLAVFAEWDDPVETDDIKKIKKFIEDSAERGKIF